MRGRRDLPCLAALYALAVISKFDPAPSDIIMIFTLPQSCPTNESAYVAASQKIKALNEFAETCRPESYLPMDLSDRLRLVGVSWEYGIVIQEQVPGYPFVNPWEPIESVPLFHCRARAETGDAVPKSFIAVRDDMSYLHPSVRQIEYLGRTYNVKIAPVLWKIAPALWKSLNTNDDIKHHDHRRGRGNRKNEAYWKVYNKTEEKVCLAALQYSSYSSNIETP